MVRTFRLRRLILYQGLAFTALFSLALAGAASLFFLNDPAAHGFRGPHSLAVVGGMAVTVAGFFLALSLYMLAAFRIEKAALDGTSFTIRSVFQHRRFSLPEVSRLRWRAMPQRGSIILDGSGGRGKVELFGYSESDRLEMIRVLRRQVPERAQEGWPAFCHRIALPLRDGTPALIRRLPPEQLVHIDRSRYTPVLTVGVPVSVVLGALGWAATGLPQFLALPVLVLASWTLLRFAVAREGSTDLRLASPEGHAVLFLFGTIVGCQLLRLGLRATGLDRDQACLGALGLLAILVPPGIMLMIRADGYRKSTERQAAERAVAEWDVGEPLVPTTRSRAS